MRFTKKQVKEIISKKTNKDKSRDIAFSMFFGIVFGIMFTSCYVLNADTVNTYWQKQYMKYAFLPDFALKITKE